MSAKQPNVSVAPVAWLLGLAALVRAVVALRTAVPDRDGATYLWMAEQIAHGRLGAAFETVFHPLYPLLIAPVLVVAPGFGAVAAGQLVACALGALAVVPLYALTARVFGARAARASGFFYAVGIWFARHPADCLSEGPFYLLVGAVVWLLASEALSRKRMLAAGVLAGLAYATRPEGLSLVLLGAPWLWLRGCRRSALAFGGAALLAALPWPLGWAAFGGGFTPTPKLAFNLEVGVRAAEDGVAHYALHLLQLPGDLLEALGYVAAPMMLLGLWLARPWDPRRPQALVAALFALQLAVIPVLRSHFRFVSGYGFLMLMFAGLTWQRSWPRWRALGPCARILLVAVAISGDLARIPQARREDRVVLRELGAYLAPRLAPGETIATDLPRLEYYAGRKPGPPRPIGRAALLADCNAPTARYAVVGKVRAGVTAGDLAAAGFAPLPLPPALQRAADEYGMLVYRRREK